MDGIDVVVRMHDPARLDELGRAVFSLALQDYRPITIAVLCQRFDAAALAAVRRELAPILAIAADAGLEVLNRPEPVPRDARAALLNQGLAAGRHIDMARQQAGAVMGLGHRGAGNPIQARGEALGEGRGHVLGDDRGRAGVGEGRDDGHQGLDTAGR